MSKVMTEKTLSTKPVSGHFFVDGTDKIETSQSDIEVGHVQFSLSTNHSITWWKGIKIFDGKNNMTSLLAMQDQDHGPDSSKKFSYGSFNETIRIEIWKAKFLGVHTCVATIFFKASECNGKNTLLHWVND